MSEHSTTMKRLKERQKEGIKEGKNMMAQRRKE